MTSFTIAPWCHSAPLPVEGLEGHQRACLGVSIILVSVITLEWKSTKLWGLAVLYKELRGAYIGVMDHRRNLIWSNWVTECSQWKMYLGCKRLSGLVNGNSRSFNSWSAPSTCVFLSLFPDLRELDWRNKQEVFYFLSLSHRVPTFQKLWCLMKIRWTWH